MSWGGVYIYMCDIIWLIVVTHVMLYYTVWLTVIFYFSVHSYSCVTSVIWLNAVLLCLVSYAITCHCQVW